MMKWMKAMALLFFGSVFLAGCNTMEGLGQDTEEAGEAMEDEAQEY